ncbi:MAG: DUF4190 domain-containing protein [Candidatus Hydrogenedentes bacterium]|nr:DUF4190 domain-containing protein [Candidatus Hydrogenedentota bacterium]
MGNFTSEHDQRPQQRAQPASSLAIASLVLGIGSYLCLGPLLSIPGIITGHMAMPRTRIGRSTHGGGGLAIAGLVLSYVNICLTLLVLLAMLPPTLSRVREAAMRATCQMHLKQLGLALRTFASASDGEIYPQLSSEPGRLMFDNDALARPVYPDFLPDLSVMVCPADDVPVFGPEDVDAALNDHSYFYLGYLVSDDKTVEAFAEVYRSYLSQGLPFEDSLKVPAGAGIAGGDTIPRLRKGVERYLITDLPASVEFARSRVPVLIERPEHHSPPGGNVLYMDGHVKFIPYPGEWPMTERTIGILESLDQM